MISHAIYDESKYKQYFVQDYKLIVPVRNPVTWIQSAASYFSAHGDARVSVALYQSKLLQGLQMANISTANALLL